ncbi:MAG: hypothetical protein V3W34_00195 [Phycisphaerae bacterium]
MRTAAGPRFLLCFLLTMSGCTGSGRVSIISTNLRELPSTGPLVKTLDAQRCFFWIDSSPTTGDTTVSDTSPETAPALQRLYIAMESANLFQFLDNGKRRMAMSLVLRGSPKSGPHSYKVDRQSLRMIQHSGYNHTRWASLNGIVSVRREADGSIRGRFKMAAKQQHFLITTGWTGRQHALLVGEFCAVHNPEAGRRIIELTESDGMARTRPTKSQQFSGVARDTRKPPPASTPLK